MSSISPPAEHTAYASTGMDDAELQSRLERQPAASVSGETYSYRHPVLSGTIKTIDIIVVCIATLAFASMNRRFLTSLQISARDTAELMSVLVVLLWPKPDRLLHLPQVTRVRHQLRYLSPAIVAAGFIQVVALCLLNWAPLSALATSLDWCLGVACGLVLARAACTTILTRHSVRQRLMRRIAIIGNGAHAFRMAERFRQDAGHAFVTVGVFSDSSVTSREGDIAGSVSDLVSLGREHTLHGVVLALPPSADHEQQVKQVLWTLRSVLADVYIMPHLVHGPNLALPFESVGPVSLMVIQRRPLTEWQVIIKLALDLTLGTIALIALFPLMLVVACAIKLDSPGPVLFRQSRLGFNNRPFMVFKFRSMYSHMTDHMAARQTGRNDPRVTRVGKWLRKLSIDELPQLLNVLRNEMSLVGPRPHAPHTRAGGKLLDEALAEYVIRHQVKPGITGWAQVNGSRGELVTTQDLYMRVALDLDYMQRWSVWFDIKIMILTVLREVVSRHSF